MVLETLLLEDFYLALFAERTLMNASVQGIIVRLKLSKCLEQSILESQTLFEGMLKVFSRRKKEQTRMLCGKHYQ